MITAFTAGGRRTRALSVAGALAVTVLALAGCSSETGTDARTSSPAASAGGDSELAATVATAEQPLDAYPVPTDAIDAVSSLAGKTVYYIPITLQAPSFTVALTGLKAGLDAVGMNLQVCDGKGTPTDISACVTQGTEAGASAIIADAIPYGLAGNAFDAAQAAGVPVIIQNQVPDDTHPASATLAYIEGGGTAMQIALAQWVALDSDGTANLLINQSTDGPSPAAYVESSKSELAKDCPDCTVTVNEISVSSFQLIPSSTSSQLLQNPDIDYVAAQFEQYLQPTQSGVQQSGRLDSVKGLTGAAQLGSLQALSNDNFLYAAAAQATAYQGWVDADASIRLALGLELPEYVIPIRLFTRDNVGDVTLSEDAQNSGEWFGPTSYTDDFLTLWGVA